MTIRAMIADDEPLARDLLAHWVRNDPHLRLVGEASDGGEALELLEKTRAQLLFLDIKMPGLDGVDTLRTIRARGLDPYVVFVTAWDQHAVKAYDLAAGDYLVKPVRKARFAQAVQRARNALATRSQVASMANTLPPLMVRQGDRMTPVSPGDIVWVQAASQYARIHTRDAEHLLSRSLADVASELPDNDFVRVHRSALVNRAFIKSLRSDHGNYRLDLGDGIEVPVARSRRKLVMESLKGSGKSDGL
jgi:two-component system LytT family response regulator